MPDFKGLFFRHKKIVIAIGVAIVAIIALIVCLNVFVFSSHGERPELDLRKAKKALEGADYHVSMDEDLEVGVKKTLSASNGDDNLMIVVFENSTLAEKAYDYLTLTMKHEIEEAKMQLSLSEYMVKNYSEELTSSKLDSYKERIKNLKKKIEEYENDVIYGHSGNIVWKGTMNAAKDSKN